MQNKYSHFTIRIEKQLFEKYKYIAKSRGRSANKEFEQYVRRCVSEYEKNNGIIDIKEKK